MDKILIVDDDVHIGDMLEEVLRKEGYLVSRAYSGTEAMLALSSMRPDLVLLDLMLPGLVGEEVLKSIRGIPVIIISAKASTEDKVALLLGGAADYITKPFDIKELLARIVVALRRANAPEQVALTFEDLRLDPSSREVRAGGESVRLTRTEYAILQALMENPAQVMGKSRLLDKISAGTPDCTESSLKMHVSHLRKKLRDAGSTASIEAIWGIGFRLKAGPCGDEEN